MLTHERIENPPHQNQYSHTQLTLLLVILLDNSNKHGQRLSDVSAPLLSIIIMNSISAHFVF